MSQFQLRARFDSSTRANEVADALSAALAAHAEEHDGARNKGKAPTNAAMLSFARECGLVLTELQLTWGDDSLANDLPVVGVLADTLVFYHGFSHGGIGPELAATLTSAGAKVVELEGPPVLFANVQHSAALENTLRTFFAQGDEEEDLSEWSPAPWQEEGYEEDGESTDVSLHVDGDRCAFTLPVGPLSFDPLAEYLAAHAKDVQLRFAESADVDAVNAGSWNSPTDASADVIPAEASPGKASSSRNVPAITHVKGPGSTDDKLTPYSAGSFNGEVIFLTGMRIFASTDGGTEFALRQEGLVGLKGFFAGKERAWGCGYGLVVSSTDGFTTQEKRDGFAQEDRDLDRDRIQLNAIAEDAEGVWTGGFEGEIFLAKDGVDFQPVAKKGKAQINAIVPTTLGTVVCRQNGEVNIAGKGKLKKTPLRARAPLYAACETQDAAVLLGGCNKEGGAVYRTTDFKEFELVSMPMNVWALDVLPDGRVIAGGEDDTLAVSYDHGRSFEVLKHEFTDTGRGFALLFQHDEHLLATQVFQHLLRIG